MFEASLNYDSHPLEGMKRGHYTPLTHDSGRLNVLRMEAEAEAVQTRVPPALVGRAWDKTRRSMMRREVLTFLKQVGTHLALLGLIPKVLTALLDLEGLQRPPWRDCPAVLV